MADNELRFEMSNRVFRFDAERDITADELWALDEVGVTEDEMVAALDGLNGDDISISRKTRALCALAYLAARREDPATKWSEFSRTIAPATWRPIPDGEPASVGEALAEKPKRAKKPEPESAPV